MRRREDRTLVEHGGALPGYRTQISICPDDRIAFIVLSNADDGEPWHYIEQAYSMMAPALRKATAPQLAPVEAQPGWERYVGKYRNQWDDSEVLITHEGLMLMASTGLDPLGTLLQLIPEGEHSFRIQGDNGYSPIGELAVFELGLDGSVVSLKIDENYTYPQSAPAAT